MKVKLLIDKILKADITMKILSFAIAVFLFIFVNEEINPISTAQFNIPLKMSNDSILLDNGLVVSNKNVPKNVSVIVKGRAKNMQSVSASDVEAYINLEKVNIKNKTQKLDVVVELANDKVSQGIFVESVNTKTVEFDIEKEAKNIFKVDFDVKGNIKAGYKLIKITAVPDSIDIHGGTEFLSQIASAKVALNVNDLMSDMSVSKQCFLFDRSGREIQVNENTYRVQVNIEIAKELKVEPVISGKPESGYVEMSRIVQPQVVYVRAEDAILSKIDTIKTESFDISGITESVSKKLLLNIPTKVKIVDDIKQLNLNIGVEKLISKSIELSPEIIAITGNNKDYSYSINSNEKILVEILGPASKIEKLNAESLGAYINVSALATGENSVKIAFKLPDMVTLQGDYSVGIKVEK